MRWTTLYLGFMAAVAGFAASVAWVSDTPWYVPAALVSLGVMLVLFMLVGAARAKKMLVVGATGKDPLYRLTSAIDDAGYALVTCPGPAERPCPVLRGDPCPIVTELAGGVALRFEGVSPPCERALGIPVVAIDRSELEDVPAVLRELGIGRN